MKVRKAIKKLVALGTGATMVGATILGAMAADLSDYPQPFVKDGQFDGLIVVGEKAATVDVVGAIDIATSIQYAAKQVVEVATGAVAGTVAISGDAVEIGEPNNLLEINETIGNVRETITEFNLEALKGGIVTTDQGSTDYNQYLRFMDQGLTATDPYYIESGRTIFGEDEDDLVDDFLFFKDGDVMFEYEIEFEQGVESDIVTRSLDDLEDENFNILGTTFSLVDTDFKMDPPNRGDTPTVILQFLGGDVADTMIEGETKTYTIDGVDYVVKLLIVSDNANGGRGSCKFSVNGEVTDELNDGETEVLADGTEIGVREIMPNEGTEEAGGDLVEFFLGANKIEFKDTNYSDDTFAEQGVEVNEENIEDARVRIKGSLVDGSATDGVFELTTIRYQLQADSPKGDVYVKEGQGVREYLDEPEGMLTPSWDIRYEGLTDTGVSRIKFDANGDDAYDLKFTSREGLNYNVPLADNGRDTFSIFKFGDEDNDLVWLEMNASGITQAFYNDSTFNIDEDDYFILTDDNDETGFTHVMSYESIDIQDQELVFTDLATGQREITYEGISTGGYCTGTCATGDNTAPYGDLIVGGNSFRVWVGADETDGSVDGKYPLAIDLDHSGAIDGQVGAAGMSHLGLPHDGFTNPGEANIVVDGGGLLDLGNYTDLTFNGVEGENLAAPISSRTNLANNNNTANAVGANSWLVRLITLASEFDEQGVGGEGNSDKEVVVINITVSDQDPTTEVDLDVMADGSATSNTESETTGYLDSNANFKLYQRDDNDDLKEGLTLYGVFVQEVDVDTDDADECNIEYPLQQRGSQVFVVAGQTKTAKSAAGEGGILEQTVVEKINVGAAKLDTEIDDVWAQNVIIVGGPCINDAGARVMGSDVPLCGEASGIRENTAKIKLFEKSGKVAMLVAGYGPDDTRRATRVVSDWEKYADEMKGTEVEVTGTTLTDITVAPPTVVEEAVVEEAVVEEAVVEEEVMEE